MTRACLAVAAPSAKKGGAASKIKKTTLDSKKAKRSAALLRVTSARPQPRVPPGVAAKGAWPVAERPGLAGPHCDRSYRLCASRLIANG